jgi:hypothetical protein
MKNLGVVIVLLGAVLCGLTIMIAAHANGENQVASVAIALASIGMVMAGSVVVRAARPN